MLDKDKIEKVGQSGFSPDEGLNADNREQESFESLILRTESARISEVRRRIEKRREAEKELREIRTKNSDDRIDMEASEISERVNAARNLSERLKKIEKNTENKIAGEASFAEENKEENNEEQENRDKLAFGGEKEPANENGEKLKEESKPNFDMGISVKVDDKAEGAFAVSQEAFAPAFSESYGQRIREYPKEESADAFFSGDEAEVRLSGFGDWDSPIRDENSHEEIYTDFLADASEDGFFDTAVYTDGTLYGQDRTEFVSETLIEPYSDAVFFNSYEAQNDDSFVHSFAEEKIVEEKIYPDVYENGVLLDSGNRYEEKYAFSEMNSKVSDYDDANFELGHIIPNELSENNDYRGEFPADMGEFRFEGAQNGEYKPLPEFEKYPTVSDFGMVLPEDAPLDALDDKDFLALEKESVWEPFEITPSYKEAVEEVPNFYEMNSIADDGLSQEPHLSYGEGDELLSFGEYEDSFGFAPLNKKELSLLVKRKEKGIELLKRQMNTDNHYPGGARLIAEDLNLQKDVIDERAILLSACAKGGFGDMVERQRAEMLSEIAQYNELVEEYEKEIGHTLPLASRAIPSDIIAGRDYQKLSYVSFAEEAQYSGEDYAVGKFSNSRMSREEKKSLLEADRKERERRKYPSDEENLFDGTMKKSVEAIDRRINCYINSFREKLDFMDNSFSVNAADNRIKKRVLKKKIRRLEKIRAKVKEEDLYNLKRYYSALRVEPDDVLGVKRRGMLESLSLRLDSVLRERDEVNSRLIELYTEGIKNGDIEKINRRGSAIRRRSSKRAKRRLSRDMRVIRERIPLDIKEKLVLAANKLIDAESYADSLEYRMKKSKVRGNARRDMKNEIRSRRRSLKPLYADYRHFLKKARKYAERADDFKKQLYWLLLLLLTVGAAVGIYLIFREQISGFFDF